MEVTMSVTFECEVWLNGRFADTITVDSLPEVGEAFPAVSWGWALVQSVEVCDGGYLKVEVD